MIRLSCRAFALALLLVAALRRDAAAQRTATPASPTARPTLVVLFTIDQMRVDYLTTRFGAGLTGGLRRLRDHGVLFTNAHQDHAITETAPGHASTLSGRFPSHTGIVRNAAGVQDSSAPLLAGGLTGPASPARFRGTTLIDWMRAADPRSRALSVSRKDRGAILPLGRARQQVYWYGLNGRFVTSRYYADSLPDWVQHVNGDEPDQPLAPLGTIAARYAGRQWTLLRDASAYPERDSVPVEHGGRDFTFPHTLSADPTTAARELVEFPWMDQATLDLALAGVRAMHLGAGPAPDLLAVSLSATDAVGHRYGMNSREMHDQILRLDRSLGVFLDSLFAERDSTRIIIALTADHGMQPYPALHFPPGTPGDGHADVDAVLAPARTRLLALGVPHGGIEMEGGMLTLDRAAFARVGVDADSTRDALLAALRRVPGIASVLRRRDLAPRAAAGDTYARRWLHMTPEDSPAVGFVSLAPYYYWGGISSATHGSPNDGDTRVPVLFWGAGSRGGGERVARFTRVVDIGPTLAALLGIAADPGDGRVLNVGAPGAMRQRSAARVRPDAAGR